MALQNVVVVFTKAFLCRFWCMLGVIRPDGQSGSLTGSFILWCAWTTGNKTKNKKKINDPLPYLTGRIRRFSLYAFHFVAKHVEDVYVQNIQFWSHLTIALPVIISIRFGKLKMFGFVYCAFQRIEFGGMEVPLYVLNLVTRRHNQSLQFFNCYPWVTYCLPHHFLYCPCR